MELKKYKNIVILVFALIIGLFLFFVIKNAYTDIKKQVEYNKLKQGQEVNFSLDIKKYNDKVEIEMPALTINNHIGSLFFVFSNNSLEKVTSNVGWIITEQDINDFLNNYFNVINELKSDNLFIPDIKLRFKENITYEKFFLSVLNSVNYENLAFDVEVFYDYIINEFFNQYELIENLTYEKVKTNAILNFKVVARNINY